MYKGMGIKLSDIVVGGESSSRAGFGSGLRRGAAAPDPRVTRLTKTQYKLVVTIFIIKF